MKNRTYIKSFCRITNEKFICDDVVISERNNPETADEFLKKIYQTSEANYPKYHKMDLLCRAGFLAAEFISKKSNLYETETALVFSNRSSSLVSDEKHALSVHTDEPSASPSIFVYTLPNIILGEISIRHKLLSENIFFIFDKFTPEFLVPYVEQLLSENQADQVVAGWVEVDSRNLDVLLYLIEKEGEKEHTMENLTNLYYKK